MDRYLGKGEIITCVPLGDIKLIYRYYVRVLYFNCRLE